MAPSRPSRRRTADTRLTQPATRGVGEHYTTPKKRRHATKKYNSLCTALAQAQQAVNLEKTVDELLGSSSDEEMHETPPEALIIQNDIIQQASNRPVWDENNPGLLDDNPAGELNGNVEEAVEGISDQSQLEHEHGHTTFHHDIKKKTAENPNAETEQLFASWRKLIPKLAEPLLQYEGRTTGNEAPSERSIDWENTARCTSGICPISNHNVLLLFYDRKS
jgi:hypothetical protein